MIIIFIIFQRTSDHDDHHINPHYDHHFDQFVERTSDHPNRIVMRISILIIMITILIMMKIYFLFLIIILISLLSERQTTQTGLCSRKDLVAAALLLARGGTALR